MSLASADADPAVHVYLLETPSAQAQGQVPVQDITDSACWALDAAERARLARLRRPVDQGLFVCAHTLLRGVLSRYAAVEPADWRFAAGPQGKPRLCPRHHPHAHLQSLRFNLSHCPGLVAVAVAHDREVGVDVEHVDGMQDMGLAAVILTPSEHSRWAQTGPDDLGRRHVLLAYWTLKEAALKAMGFGLGRVEPHRFGVVPVSDVQWQVLPFDDDPQPEQHWWLRTAPVAPPHRLAIAFERRPGEEALPALHVHRCTADDLRPAPTAI